MTINPLNILENATNVAWLRNKVISNNIANVDTPGFKRSVVNFENMLADAISGQGIKGYVTNKMHIPIGIQDINNVQPQVVTVDNTSLRMDGNNVDIDNEMAQLAKNNLLYDSLITRISGEFNSLKSVITDGR